MSKQKYVEINGETFELCKWGIEPPTWASVLSEVPRYKDIWTAYGKPSARKVSIWKAWKRWSLDMPCRIWIESKNVNFFTICGFTEWENKRYWLMITRCHNCAYEVER